MLVTSCCILRRHGNARVIRSNSSIYDAHTASSNGGTTVQASSTVATTVSLRRATHDQHLRRYDTIWNAANSRCFVSGLGNTIIVRPLQPSSTFAVDIFRGNPSYDDRRRERPLGRAPRPRQFRDYPGALLPSTVRPRVLLCTRRSLVACTLRVFKAPHTHDNSLWQLLQDSAPDRGEVGRARQRMAPQSRRRNGAGPAYRILAAGLHVA